MKLLYLLLLTLGFNTVSIDYQSTVYLCDSTGGKKYHLSKKLSRFIELPARNCKRNLKKGAIAE